jgi:hypothetical protein
MNEPFTWKTTEEHFFGGYSGYFMFEGVKAQRCERASIEDIRNQVDVLNMAYRVGFNRGVIALDKAMDQAA